MKTRKNNQGFEINMGPLEMYNAADVESCINDWLVEIDVIYRDRIIVKAHEDDDWHMKVDFIMSKEDAMAFKLTVTEEQMTKFIMQVQIMDFDNYLMTK